MNTSVIILNWNGQALLERFLPSVVAHTPSGMAEIVVADNGSSDNSVAMLQARFPEIRIIRFDKNYGFAEGYNKAIALTDTKYTVLLNSDVEVTPNWIEAPLAIMEADKSIAAVQPKILSQQNKQYFEYAGAAGGFLDMYGYPYCRGRIMYVIEEDQGQYDTQTNIFWASGACLFVRTDVYKKEGGLDANFFAHQEEIDLCWRLRARGYRIVYTPQSVVFHVGAATLKTESPQKTYLNFRNNLLMLYKNLPEKELRHVLRIRYWLDRIAAAKFFVTDNPKNALAVFRARRQFKRLMKEYKAIRNENMKRTTCTHIPELRRKSLLYSFYIGRKRTFSQLE